MVFTPEEYVRQHVAHFLVQQKKVPAGFIAIERQITINHLNRRFDLLVFNQNLQPVILVECKAPVVKITQNTLLQIANYNLAFNVNYLFVTNGLTHFFLGLNQSKFEFINELPEWDGMNF